MNLFPEITPKLRANLYYGQIIRGKLVIKNFKGDEITLKNVSHNPKKIYFVQAKQLVSRSRIQYYNRALKLERWIFQKLGKENYQKFHQSTEATSFYSFLSQSVTELLDSLNLQKDLIGKIKELFLEYKKLNSRRASEIVFEYISQEADSVQPLNQIALLGVLKKIKYTYILKVDSSLLKEYTQKVQKILTDYKAKNIYTDFRIKAQK